MMVGVTNSPEPWWSHARLLPDLSAVVHATATATASATSTASPPSSTTSSALGVDAIWLNPVMVSPMADNGYDVADPRDVDPLFGGIERAGPADRTPLTA